MTVISSRSLLICLKSSLQRRPKVFIKIAMQDFWRVSGWLVVPVLAALAGCAVTGGPDEAEQTSSVTADIIGQPMGLTCGIAYKNGGAVVDGACEGVKTLAGTPAFNYHIAFQGDFGLASGNGFYSQSLSFSSGTVTSPSLLELPKGTACGFKHSCQNGSSTETCLGSDPFSSCPAGWIQKFASDIQAPGGCFYAWCEYQDPNNLCTSVACERTNVPLGLACGITDSDAQAPNQGQCLGQATNKGVCPVGYLFHGFLDDGRHSGHGVGWCALGS